MTRMYPGPAQPWDPSQGQPQGFVPPFGSPAGAPGQGNPHHPQYSAPQYGAPQPGGPQQWGPPQPGPRPKRPSLGERIPVGVQLIVVVVGLLVVLGLYYVRQSSDWTWLGSSMPSFWVGLAVDVGIDLMLMVAVIVLGRSLLRRVVAGLLTAVALAGVVAVGLTLRYSDVIELHLRLLPYLYGALLSAQFLAWNVARRRHLAWLLVVVPAVAGIVAAQWVAAWTYWFADFVVTPSGDDVRPTAFVAFFAVDIGVLVVATLVAWAVDAGARAITGSRATPPTNQFTPGPSWAPQGSWGGPPAGGAMPYAGGGPYSSGGPSPYPGGPQQQPWNH